MPPTPTALVRAWARENGYELSDRGRIPAAVQTAYDEAQLAAVTPTPMDWSAPEGSVPPSPPPTAQPFSWDSGGDGSRPSVPAPRQEGRDGFALPALAFGIVPLLAGILGIVFGAVALGRIKSSGQRGRRMAVVGITLGSVWLVVFVVLVAIGALGSVERDDDGTVTSGGVVSAQDLRVDDCIKEEPAGLAAPEATESTPVDTFDVVPCDQPHAASVYAVFPLSGKGYPGDAAVDRFAKGGCDRELTKRFGAAGPEEFFYLHPTKVSWALGDHSVTCLVPKAP